MVISGSCSGAYTFCENDSDICFVHNSHGVHVPECSYFQLDRPEKFQNSEFFLLLSGEMNIEPIVHTVDVDSL